MSETKEGAWYKVDEPGKNWAVKIDSIDDYVDEDGDVSVYMITVNLENSASVGSFTTLADVAQEIQRGHYSRLSDS